MIILSRRNFLEIGARLGALMGLGNCATPRIAEALEQMSSGAAPVLWLQGQSCSGCSVSLLNDELPGPAELLTRYINLTFHQTLSTATGHLAVEAVNKAIAKGGYLLVVEGAVPAGMPSACQFGGEQFGALLMRAARSAKAVVAVGTCAVYGGVPAAEGNPTGATGVSKYLTANHVEAATICIPGCPAHPEWLLGCLTHVLRFGLPSLDADGRPKMFFSRLVHDQCPRFADYEREKYARSLSEPGCLFKLGCLGPNTVADCNVRLWNGGINTCIRAGAPCTGCAGKEFVARTAFPLSTKPQMDTDHQG